MGEKDESVEFEGGGAGEIARFDAEFEGRVGWGGSGEGGGEVGGGVFGLGLGVFELGEGVEGVPLGGDEGEGD